MTKDKKQILDTAQITQIITRMAYQIFEQNHEAQKIYFFGIAQNGLKLAQLIVDELVKISNIQTETILMDIDKSARSQPNLDHVIMPTGQRLHLIVVDDVLNSGRTMMHAFDPLLRLHIEKLQTCVLVNRSHTRFPIAVDYKGLELGTTIEEHIEVKFDAHNYSAFLY